MKKSGVWIFELDRFGYTLKVAAKTKEEADQTMRDEYLRTYAKWNELDEDMLRKALAAPILDENGNVDEYDPRNEFREYYKNAFEDNEPRFYEFGKVEWE